MRILVALDAKSQGPVSKRILRQIVDVAQWQIHGSESAVYSGHFAVCLNRIILVDRSLCLCKNREVILRSRLHPLYQITKL